MTLTDEACEEFWLEEDQFGQDELFGWAPNQLDGHPGLPSEAQTWGPQEEKSWQVFASQDLVQIHNTGYRLRLSLPCFDGRFLDD